MPNGFLHGVEVIEIDNGARPIRTVRSSVIGLIGTAPEADDDRFPVHTPVLLTSLRDTEGLGEEGTLLSAMIDLFDQTGAVVVLVRVPDRIDTSYGFSLVEAITEMLRTVDTDTGQFLGVHAFLAAENQVGVVPRILIAPEYSQDQSVANALITVAERLRAVVIADGPNETDEAAINYRNNFGSDRLYLIDPWVKTRGRDGEEIIRPASARVAGVIVKSDAERGFWYSPSNRVISGIVGTARDMDFTLGDPNARANLLNENEVTTIIRNTGNRLWGNRTTSVDPNFAFLSVRRTADIINESLLRAHLYAVDRTITRTFVEDVLESVNDFLRNLRARGAIINGEAFADPALNTPDQIADGKISIDFVFTPPFPAERITFRSQVVNDFLVEILPPQF